MFKESDNYWCDFSTVQNSVIDLSDKNINYLEKIFIELSNLNCKYLQIRSRFRNMPNTTLFNLIRLIKSQDFLFVQLFLEYNIYVKDINFTDLFSSCPSIGEITYYSSPSRSHSIILNSFVINYISEDFSSECICGLISAKLFAVNLSHFTESLSFNTCLNRKISIDVNGQIKNCPSMAKCYGNIRDTKLIDVVNDPEFQKVWHIKKDEITKCKDC
ncbi:MAG: SPASM domain-containing protein [Bacteroidetes bacterium]|nr:SPASM domain-containing protein [Bacteroidota bacterium]